MFLLAARLRRASAGLDFHPKLGFGWGKNKDFGRSLTAR